MSEKKYAIETDSLAVALEQFILLAREHNRGPLTIKWDLDDGSYATIHIAKRKKDA